MYKSDRGIVLVSKVPGVITVEDYCKWYDLYIIDENGIVDSIQEGRHNIPKEVMSILYDGYYDHCWTPKLVVEFALAMNWKIGTVAFLTICDMFRENHLGDLEADIPDEYMPGTVTLTKVCKNDDGVCTYFNKR